MKKGILLSVFALTMTVSSHLFAFQSSNGSAYVFADVLEWQVREGGNQQWVERINGVGTSNQTVNLLGAPFDWNTGFRVGAGYKNPGDWDVAAYYTSYRTQAVSQVDADGQVYSPYIGNFFEGNTNGSQNGPFFNAANINWKLNFNTLDLALGRLFRFDQYLVLRPFLGLKGAVINQNVYTHWQGPNTHINNIPFPVTSFSSASEHLTNYFSGVGPSFGVETTWPLFKRGNGSINLIGNFSAAILWGLWRFKDDYVTNTGVSVTTTTNNVNGAAPVVAGFVGLGWMGAFSKVDVNVRVGYEGQFWFNQMQMNTLSSGRLNDLMSLQGGVLDFGINF